MKKLFTILTVVALTTTISFAQAQFGAKNSNIHIGLTYNFGGGY